MFGLSGKEIKIPKKGHLLLQKVGMKFQVIFLWRFQVSVLCTGLDPRHFGSIVRFPIILSRAEEIKHIITKDMFESGGK